ncbi:hypothetical protein [Desulfarculus baarsii]|uniref:hypothetical protein n=1 Tax=Desulfarculus baarsii TaxID=453230 RepID=UPI0011D0929B|nr:hypothetical protein [Desulfarculus baarsii]
MPKEKGSPRTPLQKEKPRIDCFAIDARRFHFRGGFTGSLVALFAMKLLRNFMEIKKRTSSFLNLFFFRAQPTLAVAGARPARQLPVTPPATGDNLRGAAMPMTDPMVVIPTTTKLKVGHLALRGWGGARGGQGGGFAKRATSPPRMPSS